jgi:DNA-binding transcriptional LysR family regulator
MPSGSKLSTVDLRLFAAVADLGGITPAARKLGLAKSVVSRDLAALEARLGTRLVQRTTRKVSLTDTGELLATYARRVVEEMDDAEAAIEATRETPRGVLKVSLPFSILRYVLVPRLADFRNRYPEVRLALDASMRRVDLVEEGVDVAIRTGDLSDSSLVARQLAVMPFALVAARSYLERFGRPGAPQDLREHQILRLGPSVEPEVWTLTDGDGRPHQVRVEASIALHDPSLLLDLAAQGLGVAPIPLIYARQAIEAGNVERVLPTFSKGTAPIHALYPSRRILAPKVRAFVDFAAEAMACALGADRGAAEGTDGRPGHS